MEHGFGAGVIVDGMTVPAVLPKGDRSPLGGGGGVGSPEIGVDPVRCGNAVIFLQAGRNGPEQTFFKQRAAALSAAAEFAVKGIARVGISLEAGSKALGEQAFGIAG